jgi:hypothetical protein
MWASCTVFMWVLSFENQKFPKYFFQNFRNAQPIILYEQGCFLGHPFLKFWKKYFGNFWFSKLKTHINTVHEAHINTVHEGERPSMYDLWQNLYILNATQKLHMKGRNTNATFVTKHLFVCVDSFRFRLLLLDLFAEKKKTFYSAKFSNKLPSILDSAWRWWRCDSDSRTAQRPRWFLTCFYIFKHME